MDLTHLIDQDELVERRSQIKKVFFYRICGAGMGPAAVLLKQAGFDVQGADSAFYPPMSTYLETTGISLCKIDDISTEFLKQFDLIVVGNSLSGKSEAARMIEKVGVPFTSFPAALGALVLRGKKVIGIAGTHGKTTTAFFMTQLLENLDENTGYLIGGIIEGRGPAKLGDNYFVIESDEYDSAYFHKISKFRFYELSNMILTSLEFDHADIFSSVEEIEDEFRHVIPNMESTLIFNHSYPSAMKLFSEYQNSEHQKWFLYGDGSDLGPHDVKVSSEGSEFSLIWKGQNILIKTSVQGHHNILNLSGCLIFLLSEGFSVNRVQEAALKINMVKRRQEIRGKYNGMIVVDDFAHHPRAIEVTLKAMREKFQNKKIVTIFEPISATARSSIFQAEFSEALSLSDQVIIAHSGLATTALNGSDLDVNLLVAEIKAKGIPATAAFKLQELREIIDTLKSSESVLLVLSNRTCLGLWESDFVKKLES